MYKNVLASIPGIELYPIVALTLFVAVFAGLIVWFVRVDRAALNANAEHALDDGTAVDPQTTPQQYSSRG